MTPWNILGYLETSCFDFSPVIVMSKVIGFSCVWFKIGLFY